jgi:serine/threonine protein phosphatase PrpC
MEDTHICNPIDLTNDEKGMIFAVFDGHGGDEVAKFAKDQF